MVSLVPIHHHLFLSNLPCLIQSWIHAPDFQTHHFIDYPAQVVFKFWAWSVKEIDDVANLHPGSDTITTPQRSVGQSPPNTIVACFLQASRLNAIRCRSFKVCSSEVYHSSLAAVKFQEAASKSAEIAE